MKQRETGPTTDGQLAAMECRDREAPFADVGDDWETLIDVLFWPPMGARAGGEEQSSCC